MTKRRIDDHCDFGIRIFFHEAHHGFTELLKTRHRPAFGRKVGPVNHNVSGSFTGVHDSVISFL